MATEKKDGKVLTKKIFDLSKYKVENKLNDGLMDKDAEYILLSPAFQTITGLSGLIKGTVNLFRGYSNTGKSTALIETMIGCQRSGTLPVIIDTENSFNWSHARDMGFEFTEIYGPDTIDEETGEVVKNIINYEGFFIYANNDHLHKIVGKKRTPELKQAVIEDVAGFMEKLMDDQTNGDLQVDLCFLWDSIGTLKCEKAALSSSANNMWDAGAMESAFKSVANYRIPASRKENKEYTNTLVAVQKIWFDSMSGAGVVKHKGGEAMYYSARYIFHFGGVQSHGSKKLVAKVDGREYIYGRQSKVGVEKNHIGGVSFNGEIVSTAHGFIGADKPSIDAYKKKYKNYILDKLNAGSDSAIMFEEQEDNNPE